ncbi:caspase-8-like [Lineus longissimus]|uniref:caspase-8-like n=1 Tax=Lineus longissimus TaxID=88925 RepID=UPI002B4E50DD
MFGKNNKVQADAVSPSYENIRIQLNAIAQNLDEDDIQNLKCLCHNYIPYGKLTEIKSGLALLEILCNRNLVGEGNTRFLAECLEATRRSDLLEKLGTNSCEVQNLTRDKGSLLDPYRVMIMKVAACLDATEVNELAFCLSDYLPRKSTTYDSAYSLLSALERSGDLGRDNCDLLEKYVEAVISNPTALGLIRNYKVARDNENDRKESNAEMSKPEKNPLQPSHESTEKYRGVDDNSRFRDCPVQVDAVKDNSEDKCTSGNREAPDITSELPRVRLQNTGTRTIDEVAATYFVRLAEGKKSELSTMEMEQKCPGSSSTHISQAGVNVGISLGHDEVQVSTASPTIHVGDESSQCSSDDHGLIELPSVPTADCPKEPRQSVCSHRNPESLVLADIKPPGQRNLLPSTQASVNSEATEREDMVTPASQFGFYPTSSGAKLPAQAAVIGNPSFQGDECHVSLFGELGTSGRSCVNEWETSKPADGAPLQPLQHDLVKSSVDTINVSSNEMTNHQEPLAVLAEDLPKKPSVIKAIRLQVAEPLLKCQSEKVDEDVLFYKMTADPRGLCLIINNMKFREEKLRERIASDRDRESLEGIFKKLKFKIQSEQDLTSQEIMDVVKKAAYGNDHSLYDCFVCCILSHGAEGIVYGTDVIPVNIRKITEHFTGQNCPTLNGKPKLFFIEACQGNRKDVGVRADGTNSETRMSPTEADFLMGYATPPGYAAYLDKETGSFYIQKLVDTLEKYSDREDITSIMVMVNGEVAKDTAEIEGGLYKQIPKPEITLTKKVFLRK